MPRWENGQTGETRRAVLSVLRALADAGGVEATSGEIARACKMEHAKVRWVLDSLVISGDVRCRTLKDPFRKNRRLWWSLITRKERVA